MKIKLIALIIILNVSVLLSIFTQKVIGLESKTFTISPPNFEISANPGESYKNTVKIVNISKEKITITAKPQNFVAYGDGGQVELTEDDTSYSINKWIKFDNSAITIEPLQSYLFAYEIVVPKNAEPGSHYGAIAFSSTDPTAGTNTTGANVVQTIGALILIRVPGDVTEEAKIVSFEPTDKAFPNPEIKFNALVENTGGVHFKMNAFVNIYDVFGNKVKSFEVSSKNVLPGSKRIFDAQTEFSNIGYFRAEIEMFYASGEKVLKAETNFFALNMPLLLPIVLVTSGIIVMYVVFRKRINKAVRVMIKG